MTKPPTSFELSSKDLEKAVNSCISHLENTLGFSPAQALFILNTSAQHIRHFHGMSIESEFIPDNNVRPIKR